MIVNVTNYTCVASVEGIKQYIGGHREVAIDFETTPDTEYCDDDKAALDPARSHICGCSFSVSEGSAIYVPVAHRCGTNINKDAFFEYLSDILTDTGRVKIVHNITFEAMVAQSCGITIQPPVYDTMCAAQLTLKSDFEYRTLSESGLKTLVPEIFGETLPTFEQVTEGRNFDELDGHDAETVRYGCADADYALRLYHACNEWFRCFLPKHRYIVENVESPAAVYCGAMKFNGIPVDLNLMRERKVEAEAETDRIREEIQAMVGGVNIGVNCSTAAFKKFLFNDCNLPVLKSTDKGAPAVDDEAIGLLKEWSKDHRPDLVPLFELVQDYRKWGKVKSTYIDGYLRYVNPVTGRIHPDMLLLSTDTGRMSCRNPNAQNMPRTGNDPIGIRKFITAPEGCKILSLDLSQIELRVGAFFCRDEVMIDTYHRGGDIHAATASVIFGISYDEAVNKDAADYKERRAVAKNVNFGTFYGLFPKGLQKTLKSKAGIDMSISDCEDILDNLKAGYRGLTAWQIDTKADAAKRIYVETWLGRRRYLPEITSDDWGKKAYAERCALNTPIQGTAADILKLAMGRILCGLRERPWLYPILQIHDELVFVVQEGHIGDAVEFIRQCMEAQPFPEFDVPLVAEAVVGKTYGDLSEVEDNTDE